ncbi:hypothetical protein MRX96_014697 [Rhipicephalus microplus]
MFEDCRESRTPSHEFECQSSPTSNPTTLTNSRKCRLWAPEAVPVAEGILSSEKPDPKSRTESDGVKKIQVVASESSPSRNLGLLGD